MVKRHKKIFRIGLLAGVLAALMCVSAGALTSGDWEYQLLGNEAQITGYNGPGGDIVIPSSINGATVTDTTSIWKLFKNKATSITYPDTIKEANFNCSYGWEELESVTFSEGVESIVDSSILTKLPNLTEVNLPSTLKSICEHAFRNTGIRHITIPAGVKTIEDTAFEGSALESADLSAMRGAELGTGLFASCKNLTEIKLPPDLKTIPQSLAQYCEKLQYIDIPASVTEIKNVAFSHCDLRQVYLPTGLKDTGAGTFANNPNLTELIIPYGVISASSGGKYSFSLAGNCENLKAVYVPDTVKTMGVNFIEDSPNAIVYCSAGSYAEQFCKEHKISYQIDPSVNTRINVLYNGKRISFGKYGQNPILQSGNTLVPLRSIFETMGATVDWDGATQTVTSTRGGTTVKLTIGQRTLYRNGTAVTLEVPAQLINDTTMVPVRAVAESFNATVGWVQAAQTVTIDE